MLVGSMFLIDTSDEDERPAPAPVRPRFDPLWTPDERPCYPSVQAQEDAEAIRRVSGNDWAL